MSDTVSQTCLREQTGAQLVSLTEDAPAQPRGTSRDVPVELMSMTFTQLESHLERVGVPVGHAKRVFRGLHRTSTPLDEIPSLGRYAKALAPYHHPPLLRVERCVDAEDGTRKLLMRLSDGGVVESVLLPMRRERFTLCVSTQVGCAMACAGVTSRSRSAGVRRKGPPEAVSTNRLTPRASRRSDCDCRAPFDRSVPVKTPGKH